MELILDANILISALIRDSHTRHFLLLSNHTFYVPEYLFEEINNHTDEIEEKSSLSKDDIKELFEDILLISNIKVIPFSEFREFIEEAKKISPDIDDVIYFALALKFNCPIWSNDKKLKEQKRIIIYGNKEIING